METMTRQLVLAAFLGMVIGLAIGYSPLSIATYSSRPQLLMQQTVQPTAAVVNAHVTQGLTPIIMALLIGLIAAGPVFFIAKRRAA